MSLPYCVLVRSTRGTVEGAYGPFEEDEADWLVDKLRREYELRAEAVRLQAWVEELERAKFKPPR